MYNYYLRHSIKYSTNFHQKYYSWHYKIHIWYSVSTQTLPITYLCMICSASMEQQSLGYTTMIPASSFQHHYSQEQIHMAGILALFVISVPGPNAFLCIPVNFIALVVSAISFNLDILAVAQPCPSLLLKINFFISNLV